MSIGEKIAVIPAGERWSDDDSLRPAIEDWIGAGAIISYLTGVKSPEAMSAESVFSNLSINLEETLSACSSGSELVCSGFREDIQSISMLNTDDTAPILKNGYYSK